MFPTSGLINQLQADLLRDLLAFLPELLLCGTIVLMLLARLVTSLNRVHLGTFALAMVIVSLGFAIAQWIGTSCCNPRQEGQSTLQLFTGLLVYDSYSLFVRVLLISSLALMIWLSLLTGIPDREDSADFFTLLIGSTIGMILMGSANHLLSAFIAVEMASVPSYALAGFLKGENKEVKLP